MPSSIAFEPVAPAPPAALLARFDRAAPRNLALPPLQALSAAFTAFELTRTLAARRRSDGPGRNLPLHLLARLPCGACPDAEALLASVAREACALAEAMGGRQRIARVTVQACDGMGMGDRRLGAVLDALGARFRLSGAEVCVEVPRVDLPTLRDWRDAGATRLLLTAPSPDPVSVARASELMPVAVAVDCARRGIDADALADSLRSFAGRGVARVDIGTHGCTPAAVAPSCRDASRPVSPPLRRAAVRARAVDVLQREGFQLVACGLFVRADDPLVTARERGRLHLEVDGLAVAPAAGTLAVGPGAFGRLASVFYRNAGGPAGYVEAVALRGLSVAAGVALSRRDLAARSAVLSLACNGRLDFEAIALAHLVEPERDFTRALRDLAPMVRAGLVDVDADGVELTAQGRHLVDVVAALFE